jgi:hypothetical protein
MLQEHNTRTGFFEESEFRAVIAHLPEDLPGVPVVRTVIPINEACGRP